MENDAHQTRPCCGRTSGAADEGGAVDAPDHHLPWLPQCFQHLLPRPFIQFNVYQSAKVKDTTGWEEEVGGWVVEGRSYWNLGSLSCRSWKPSCQLWNDALLGWGADPGQGCHSQGDVGCGKHQNLPFSSHPSPYAYFQEGSQAEEMRRNEMNGLVFTNLLFWETSHLSKCCNPTNCHNTWSNYIWRTMSLCSGGNCLQQGW